MGNSDRKPGLIKRLWKWWRTPSRLALGTLLLIGFVGGIVGDFAGRDQKGIPRAQLKSMSVDFQYPFPGQDKMDQLVGAVDRAVVMPRRTGFVPRTVQRKIRDLFLLQGVAGLFVFDHKASIA